MKVRQIIWLVLKTLVVIYLIFGFLDVLIDDNYDCKWFEDDSPYGRYAITATQTQESDDLFNNFITAKITLSDKMQKQYPCTFEVYVASDNDYLSNTNYKLNWYEDHIKIDIIDYDSSSRSYRIYWNDLESIS